MSSKPSSNKTVEQILTDHPSFPTENKLYRKHWEGAVDSDQTRGTRIKLNTLTCHYTEDNAGEDECELRIWWDNNYTSRRRGMNNNEVWNLGITLEFQYRVKIQLWDLDNPNFPVYDSHDWLGTITIAPGQAAGRGIFDEDGALYVLEWGAP